ncbi:MAG TPA: hypothetical protein VGN90_12405 [Pyrinomonadaceae bacterium]|jgi:hypothetical protein|nr:hypothetical protein [Pyrinomonadaceae bacterium]
MSGGDDVRIGDVVRNATVFNVNNWRAGVMNNDNLFEAVGGLFSLLEERKIEYLLVGGIALLKYVEGRNTDDIDLIMALASLRNLPEIEVTSEDENFASGKFGDLKIDVLLTQNTLFDDVRRQRATKLQFGENEISCATVEGLLLLKLYALPSLYRQGKFARVNLYEGDIAALLEAYQPELEPLFKELSDHLSSTDLASVRAIVKEIEERLKRFRNGFGSSPG